MAEYVRQSIEEMLPELEQMVRVGLLTEGESRLMMKKRKTYEYRLRRRQKKKSDFLQYIRYEMHVLHLVKRRREKIGYSHKKTEIDYSIVHRIHMLFKLACRVFKEDEKLWLSHVEFCKDRHEKIYVDSLYSDMLHIHSNKPVLWILAAKWQIEENVSFENARGLLQRGLAFNPVSKELWIEMFRLELAHTEQLLKQLSSGSQTDVIDEQNAIKSGKVAGVVYREAIGAVPEDVDFTMSLLSICQLFSFAQRLEKEIYVDIMTRFPNSTQVKAVIARKRLDAMAGVSTGELDHQTCTVNEADIAEILDHCGDVLTRSLTQNHIPPDDLKRINCLCKLFDTAEKSKKLNVRTLTTFIRFLLKTGQVDRVLNVCGNTDGLCETDADLLLDRLTALVCCNVTDDIKNDIQKLIEVSGESSVQVWRFVLDWFATHSHDELDRLFEVGLNRSRDVVVYVKEQYFKWLCASRNVKTCRKTFRNLSSLRPVSLDLFLEYIKLELSQQNCSAKRVRKAYEGAVQEFGSAFPDIWLNYIGFELSHTSGECQNVGTLYWRAVKMLSKDVVDSFTAKYSKILNSIQHN